MDFRLTDEQLNKKREFVDVCKDLEKQKPPTFIGMEWDAVYTDSDCWEYHLYCANKFAQKGWLALSWPPEYGGTGNMMDKVLFTEARSYHEIPGVDVFGIQMLAPTLIHAGSEELKKEFLPQIAAAKLMFCELWSEPNAGSDLASLSSTAVRKGDEFILNGQKTWTTGAHRADWAFGVFKSDPDARKHHNLTFLLLDMKTPGITIRPIKYMDLTHVYNEVYLDDVHVPARYMVGEEHEGWAVVNLLAGFERSRIDDIMRIIKGLERLIAYCNVTKKDGQILARHPLVRNKLAQIACETEAARTLAYCVADKQNRNEISLIDAAAVKVFSSELGQRLDYLAMDILGPYGQVILSRWSPMQGIWQKAYNSLFADIISMGSNEIQRNIIAWYGLELPRIR